VPKETAWFADVNLTSAEITPLKERDVYKEDWLGLKKLDKKGGLIFESTPGEHMRLTDEVLIDAFKTYFGPVDKKFKSRSKVVASPNLEL
jgi:palmitoyl-protein thioesterase